MTGHRCCQAYTGREALRAAKQERPDIVLLDINLPDMDGFQVMAQIGTIPVIYVTARDEVTDRVRGLNSGAEDYIVKPLPWRSWLPGFRWCSEDFTGKRRYLSLTT